MAKALTRTRPSFPASAILARTLFHKVAECHRDLATGQWELTYCLRELQWIPDSWYGLYGVGLGIESLFTARELQEN